MDLHKLLEQTKSQTSTNNSVTNDIIKTIESQQSESNEDFKLQINEIPEQQISKTNNSSVNENESDEFITIEDLDPSNVFADTDYFWKFEEGVPVIYRRLKTGGIKKFEKRSRSFRYLSPVLLGKIGLDIIYTQYIERGQFMVVVQYSNKKFLIIDDFTSQTLGKLINLDTFELIQFKHNKQEIEKVLQMIIS